MNSYSGHYHFVGIGGAGMSALAEAMLDLGASVSGSDASPSETTRALEARGTRVYAGHAAENVGAATRLVVTGALAPDNPEVAEARARGIPIVRRAELLGELMDLRTGIAIAGTHGKTSTSAMVAWVLARAGRDPAYMVGGTIRGLGPGGHWGRGEELVAEADEYDRSFLHLRPRVAAITNIESDHLEYYGSEEAIQEAFRQFARNVRPGGLLLICEQDPGALSLHDELVTAHPAFRVQGYGSGGDAIWQAAAVSPNRVGGSSYRAVYDGEALADVSIQVPGRHNVLNSLAALAACAEVGVPAEEAARHLGSFLGAGRRFELVGEAAGVTVVDDYAHHPTEIAATLQAARQRYPGRRLVVVFQPHTYTRTRDFLEEFAGVLSAADYAIVTEIYASRERDTLGMSGRQIVERIRGGRAAFASNLEEACSLAISSLGAGDVLLTMGAGDVHRVAGAVLSALARHIPEDTPEGMGTEETPR